MQPIGLGKKKILTDLAKKTLWTITQMWYIVWLTICIYMVLYLFTNEIIFYQVKLSVFYNVQTINLTFVGKIWDVQ